MGWVLGWLPAPLAWALQSVELSACRRVVLVGLAAGVPLGVGVAVVRGTGRSVAILALSPPPMDRQPDLLRAICLHSINSALPIRSLQMRFSPSATGRAEIV